MALDPRLTGGRRPGRDRKLTPSQEMEVIRDWRLGEKILFFKDRYGITKPTLYAILDRNGVERARKQPPPATTGA